MNLKLLRTYIDASGLKLNFISEKLGITYVSFYQKLSGKSQFTMDQAIELKKVLNLTDEQWIEVISPSD